MLLFGKIIITVGHLLFIVQSQIIDTVPERNLLLDIARSGARTIGDIVNRWLISITRVAIPIDSQSSSASFSIDAPPLNIIDKSTLLDILRNCPRCEYLDDNDIIGFWHLIYANEQLLEQLTIDQQLNPIADQLSCVQINVGDRLSNDAMINGVQHRIDVYLSNLTRSMRIPALLRRHNDGRLALLIAHLPTITLCPIYSNPPVDQRRRQWTITAPDTIVLLSMDGGGFPGCTDYIVLSRDRLQYLAHIDGNMRNHLRSSSIFDNRLRYIPCSLF